MKTANLFSVAVFATAVLMSHAETVTIDDTPYQINTLKSYDVGPGVHYRRLRIPEYPLNINMLTVDVTNQYNTIETTQANDRLFGTERLVDAAARRSFEGHQVVAGANANFWCVSTSIPYSDVLLGVTFNGNMANGKIITETNCHADQWDRGPAYIGEVALTADNRIFSEHFTFKSVFVSDKTGEVEIHQANKIVRDGEICMYNDYYGRDRNFICVNPIDRGRHFEKVDGVATEVILSLDKDSKWSSGNDIAFTVTEIRDNAGTGTLGSGDLALVGRGDRRDVLRKLSVGDKVTLNYNWILPDGSSPELTQLIGGNGQVMIDGELTELNTISENCALVYSKVGYGSSADHKTLYVFVIDKSTDPVYGASAGCTSAVMCQIARHFGCNNLTNFDSGGSAMMLIGDRIVNKTTEGSPRAVANGWLVYSTAPVDNNVSAISTVDSRVKMPVFSTCRPSIAGYNKYGALVTTELGDVTYTSDSDNITGGVDGFMAGGVPGVYTVTAHYGESSVSFEVEVIHAEPAIKLNPIVIDAKHPYTLEVGATIDKVDFSYDPSKIVWSLDDADVCSIDEYGTLKTLAKEGKTTLTGQIGSFSNRVDVLVQCPRAESEDVSPWDDQWTVKGFTGVSKAALDAQTGIVSYTLAAGARAPYLQLARDVTVYGIPTKIELTFNSSAPLSTVEFDLRNQAVTRTNMVKLDNNGSGFEAGTEYTVELPLSTLGDTNYNGTYPVNIPKMVFRLDKAKASAGSHTLSVKPLVAFYDFDGGVNDISLDRKDNTVTAMTAEAGSSLTFADGCLSTTVTAMNGAVVAKGNGPELTAPSVPGIYIVVLHTTSGRIPVRLIVR